MSHRHHHHDRDWEFAAKLFGLFMLLAGIMWLIVTTYGLVLLVPAGGVWLYRRKTGRWPGRR